MNSDYGTKLFIPRPEYHVFPLDVPPLSRKEREQAVINRLRGMYPGKLDDKYIVILPNGKRGSCLSFVFEDSLKDDPLGLSTLAAVKLCGKKQRYCVIACGGWIEYVILAEKRILSSMVTAAETNLADQLIAQAPVWLGITENTNTESSPVIIIEIFCPQSDIPAESTIENRNIIFRFTALEKVIVPSRRSAWSCFPERLPYVKRRRRLIAAAACAALFVFAFFSYGLYKKQEALNAARRETERLIAMENEERKARAEKLAALKETWEKQQSEQCIGVYGTIEILASCLNPGIRFSTAAIKEDGSFRFEGSSRNVMAALENLQSHPGIINAEIGTIVWEGRMERFTVNGTAEKHLLMPEESLSETDMIAWYEAVLINSARNELLPGTAAAAAQQVRELLDRHRLSITRFRFLNTNDAQSGWVIECSVGGTGMQIVQVIKEADTSGIMRVMSLETRNRQNSIDAVIAFFVKGPGEEDRHRNYNEHPSLAEIASLYGSLPVRSASVFSAQAPQITTTTGFPVTAPPVSAAPALLEYVGYVGTIDGRRYIYVKDTKTGELYRLAEGEGSYSYKINSEGLITANIGSSSPVEVRRNDGF